MMRGKLTKDWRANWFPTVAIVLLGLGGTEMVIEQCWKLPLRFPKLTALAQAAIADPPAQPRLPVPARSPQVETLPQAVPAPEVSPKRNPPAIAARLGALRVSNPTNYPIRVALLTKTPVKQQNSPSASYDIPAHWDFAPQEGGAKGLVVSLPDRTIRVKPGDILVAFAQDGSRRYWGPYVVGETELPTWSNTVGEWRLVLQP